MKQKIRIKHSENDVKFEFLKFETKCKDKCCPFLSKFEIIWTRNIYTWEVLDIRVCTPVAIACNI